MSRRTHPTPGAGRTRYPAVDLENGRYTFAVYSRFGGSTSTDAPEGSTTARPTDSTTNADSTVTATSGRTTTQTKLRDRSTVACVALFEVSRIYADTTT